ncbi:MAG: hypothetical protein ACRENO_03390 [Thermodesulfobacteriota bacterium]
MTKLIINVISRFLENYFSNVPSIPKDWFILNRILFYIFSTFIYLLAFIVVITVVLIVSLIAFPISMIYKL